MGWRGYSDRKSTRLNSSHLVISYAVFCLKKKQNKGQLHIHTIDRHGNTASHNTRRGAAPARNPGQGAERSPPRLGLVFFFFFFFLKGAAPPQFPPLPPRPPLPP